MNGIELAEKFYREHGENMLTSNFPELFPRLAVGIAGRGSECFGFDDEFSQDHDYSIGFTIWLSAEDDEKYGFKLARAYSKIANRAAASSALGYQEHGVCIIEDFFSRHLGFPGVPRCYQEWLYTPEYAFAEVLNGKIFRDDNGNFSAIRRKIATGMPHDVRLKKLAARAVMMAQSGQYNFERCLKHREPGAAALALAEFVRHTISMIFLLNFSFAPYYKWQFRAMRQLPKLAYLADDLENLLIKESAPSEKSETVQRICSAVIYELAVQKLSAVRDDYLEPHAFEIAKQITNQEIRALHIMEG